MDVLGFIYVPPAILNARGVPNMGSRFVNDAANHNRGSVQRGLQTLQHHEARHVELCHFDP
jgi:hypothetical protein